MIEYTQLECEMNEEWATHTTCAVSRVLDDQHNGDNNERNDEVIKTPDHWSLVSRINLLMSQKIKPSQAYWSIRHKGTAPALRLRPKSPCISFPADLKTPSIKHRCAMYSTPFFPELRLCAYIPSRRWRDGDRQPKACQAQHVLENSAQ